MNPYVMQILAKMRVADLHAEAEHARLVSLAIRSRRARRKQEAAAQHVSTAGVVALREWVSTLLGGARRASRSSRPVVGRGRPA